MMNGVKGVKFTSKTNGSSIFLPAAGKRYDSVLSETGVKGNYWTSTQDSSNAFAYCLCFDAFLTYCSDLPRNNGVSIRPVIAVCDSLQISSTELSLKVGEKERVVINSGSGNYIEQSSDASVATATVSGSTVTVTAMGEGIANITVTDIISRQTAAIEVTVRPKPFSCPDENHPHVIDLGLPSGTKWACCNVGASSPEAYGGYVAWGERWEKGEYTFWNYAHFNNDKLSYYQIGSDISGTKYDVAHVEWGDSWRMPTIDEVKELVNNCSWKWNTYNGVNGQMVTGPNDNKIFLPAAGYRSTGLYLAGKWGYYYSSTCNESGTSRVYQLYFSEGSVIWLHNPPDVGQSVRPVQ